MDKDNLWLEVRRLREEVHTLRQENLELGRELGAWHTPGSAQTHESCCQLVQSRKGRRGTRGAAAAPPAPLPFVNGFSALDGECQEDSNKVHAGTLPPSRCLVVGDNQVRYIDRDRRRRTRVCFPRGWCAGHG